MSQIVNLNRCPACGAQPGVACRTPIGGRITDLVHDRRVAFDLARSATVTYPLSPENPYAR